MRAFTALLCAAAARAFEHGAPAAGALRAVPRQRLAPRMGLDPGARTSVTLVSNGRPKKLRKKQRRSQSPLLYPAKSASGVPCWLQLGLDQRHLASCEAPVAGVVLRTLAGVSVVTPDGVVARPPGRLLGDLRRGDRVAATVAKMIGSNVALVVARDVYRKVGEGYVRQKAALPGCGGLAVGDSADCYVTLAAVNSGRLTLSREPAATTPKAAKNRARLEKQISRGTLAVGKKRVATVTAVDAADARVDAGGLAGTVPAADGGGERLEPGDRVLVAVRSFDVDAMTATFDPVDVDDEDDGMLPLDDDGDADPAE